MYNQLPENIPVYIYRDIVDFRKSINGLSAIVETEFGVSPFSKGLFVFCCRRRNKIKCLCWDKTGFSLWYKRLEENKFEWPRKCKGSVIKITKQQFKWLLSGVDISKINPHKPLYYQGIS